MNDIPKNIRKKIRGVYECLYERYLSLELNVLEEGFRRWHDSKMNVFELNDLIHRYHNKAARYIYGRFSHDSSPEWEVLNSLINGMLKEEEVPEDVLDFLAERFEVKKGHFAKKEKKHEPYLMIEENEKR